jgi:hypothetical protein
VAIAVEVLLSVSDGRSAFIEDMRGSRETCTWGRHLLGYSRVERDDVPRVGTHGRSYLATLGDAELNSSDGQKQTCLWLGFRMVIISGGS